MQGTDLAAILAVRRATTRRLTAAGGITTWKEIDHLDAEGVGRRRWHGGLHRAAAARSLAIKPDLRQHGRPVTVIDVTATSFTVTLHAQSVRLRGGRSGRRVRRPRARA